MSLDETPPQDELDRIIPSAAPSHTADESPLGVFKPWHLPRKHHLRKKQWAEALDRLLDEVPDRKLIKYLCLPGEDLLDIEVMAAVCRAKQRRIQYLGFDQSFDSGRRSTQRLAAEQIVRQTEVVEETSLVLPDNFASIARQDSIGSRHLRDGGSYDAVNLDMCDAFTSHDESPTHAAILELLTHQANSRGEPWLLFITTRTEIARLQIPELNAYAQAIEQNAAKSEEFLRCLASVGALENPTDATQVVTNIRDRIAGDTFLSGRWLSIGIGKWLLGIMGKKDPWRVDLLSVYSYRTGLLSADGEIYAGEPPNLFSLVFRFEKIQQVRHDPTGIAPQPAKEFAPFDEVKLAEKLAKCVDRYTVDLDRHLQADPTTHSQVAAECQERLSVRYYSGDAYRSWFAGLPVIA